MACAANAPPRLPSQLLLHLTLESWTISEAGSACLSLPTPIWHEKPWAHGAEGRRGRGDNVMKHIDLRRASSRPRQGPVTARTILPQAPAGVLLPLRTRTSPLNHLKIGPNAQPPAKNPVTRRAIVCQSGSGMTHPQPPSDDTPNKEMAMKLSWIRKLVARSPRTVTTRRSRPGVESLEQRSLLSASPSLTITALSNMKISLGHNQA